MLLLLFYSCLYPLETWADTAFFAFFVAIDSVEDTGATWVRSAGFEEAWRDFGDRAPRAQL